MCLLSKLNKQYETKRDHYRHASMVPVIWRAYCNGGPLDFLLVLSLVFICASPNLWTSIFLAWSWTADCRLTFKDHVYNIVSRVSQTIGILMLAKCVFVNICVALLLWCNCSPNPRVLFSGVGSGQTPIVEETLTSGPSGIYLPGTELLQSPFRMEFSRGSLSRRYRRSLWRHRQFLRSYHRSLWCYCRSLHRCCNPWGDRRSPMARCGDASLCATH